MAAPDTLKAQLEAVIADSKAREQAQPGHHDGDDWWQLTAAEEEVFGIEPGRFPRMAMTWHCYQGFKLMADSPLWDEALIQAARQQRPEWCGGEQAVGEFADFAKVYGGLTNREAFAMFFKQQFWEHRAGADE